MDRLRRLEIAVKVAEAGSFAKAANALMVTPSAVSHAVAQLERELGVALFYRTTRQLRLSPEGTQALHHAREVLAALERLDTLSSGKHDQVAGKLKLGIPPGMAQHILMPVLPRFTEHHPEVQIELSSIVTEANMHLTGADLVFRIGPLADSELVARPLAHLQFGVYAAPRYLERHGVPQHPQDLAQHRALIHKSPRSTTIAPWDLWPYQRGEESGSVQMGHHFVSDEREALLVAALAGAGVFRMGMFSPALLESGRLVRLLDDWQWLGHLPLTALYRRMPSTPRRITAFLDFAQEAIRGFDPQGMTLQAV